MPDHERFIAKLEVDGKGTTNLKSLKVTITRATRKTDGTDIPYIAADRTDHPGDDEKVWLQVWHCDSFEGQRGGKQKTNAFLVEIPGYVKQTQAKGASYEFRVLDTPTLGTGDSVGWFNLKLKNAAGEDYGPAAGFAVPILGDADDDVDLGCTLEKTAGTKTHANEPWKKASCLHVSNMTHIVGSMIAEGGLTLCFYIDLNGPEGKADRKQWNDEGRPDLNTWRGPQSKKLMKDIINDAEFEVQGEAFAKKFHSLSLTKNNDLVCASNPFYQGTSEIISRIDAIRRAVHVQFLGGVGDPPKLRRIAIMTHGEPWGICVRRPQRWIGHDDVAGFASSLAPHLRDDAVVTLFACLAGSGGKSDADFGDDAASGRWLGQGSFAGQLCQALKENGLSKVAVWGHTTAGHTTGNPMLRAYVASTGDRPITADLVWMALGDPPSNHRERQNKVGSWLGKMSKKRDDIMHVSILHPGADVQRCNGGACTA